MDKTPIFGGDKYNKPSTFENRLVVPANARVNCRRPLSRFVRYAQNVTVAGGQIARAC